MIFGVEPICLSPSFIFRKIWYNKNGDNMNFHNLTEQAYFVIKVFSSFAVFINSFLIFIKTQKLLTSKNRIIIVFIINIVISIVYGFFNPYTTIVQTLSFFGIALSFIILNTKNKTKALIRLC